MAFKMKGFPKAQGTGGSGMGQKHMADIETSKQEPMQGLTWVKNGKKQFVSKEEFLSNWDKHMAELREGGADQATISKAMSWKKASEQRLK